MSVFQKNKNIMMEGVMDIINDMVINGASYTRSDIEKYFDERNIAFFEHEEIIKDSDFVFYQNTKEHKMEPRIPLMVPYYLQDMEKKCLHELANDLVASSLLEERTIEKINQLLLYENKDINIYRNQSKMQERLKEKRDIVSELVSAIKENRGLEVCYQKGQQEQYQFLPYKLFYSNRRNTLQVIGRNLSDEANCILEIVDIISVTRKEHYESANVQEWIEQQKREMELRVDKTTNAVERCFSIFSHLDKTAKYDRELECYQLTIEYYSFEEEEIIKDILSFGSQVIVMKPARLRNRLVEIIQESAISK